MRVKGIRCGFTLVEVLVVIAINASSDEQAISAGSY
jgi:prepilin-type N-terminal cleavage/methylation domain-containing protein